MTSKVNQKGASANGDIVAGNKTENHYHASSAPAANIVEQLLNRLKEEVERNEQVRHTIESLQRFQTQRADDGITGLEAKLKAANREHELIDALEKKELFAKLLEKWSLYASAQEIFAHLLAKAEYEFNYFIRLQSDKTELEINQLVNDRVVVPTLTVCGAGTFLLDHSTVMGMVYWLAEQCYIRWHK